MLSPPLHFVNENHEIDTEDLFSEVLLVESDESAAEELKSALDGVVGVVDHVRTGTEALSKVESCFFEMVIIDMKLPDLSSINLLHTIEHYRPGLPIIIVTGTSCLDEALHAMREGAWDYVVKSSPETLRDRVMYAVGHAAERKIRSMQEIELRAERNAFWAAVQTAENGLGILASNGMVSQTNSAFKEFCYLLGQEHNSEAPVNIVRLLETLDPTTAHELLAELRNRSTGDTLWSAEVLVPSESSDNKKFDRYYKLTLSCVAMGGPARLNISNMPEMRRYVLWTRDITWKKERERFQRDLISTTSHDLKGPLGTISCAAEMIEEGEYALHGDVARLVERIHSCARKSLSQIEKFLSARKIEEGVLTVEPTWQDADTLVQDIINDYQMMAEAKDISLLYKRSEDGLQAFADRLAINRVLGNLITNAIKFTPSGGQVELKTERIGDQFRIAVADNGPGIDATARHLLFSRFGRLKEHAHVEGTGLGLYIAKNIVEAHNGHIDVHSHVGEGTEFVIYLPDPRPHR